VTKSGISRRSAAEHLLLAWRCLRWFFDFLLEAKAEVTDISQRSSGGKIKGKRVEKVQ